MRLPLVLPLLLILSTIAHASNWADHALRLTGESLAVRDGAIRALKAIPSLDEELSHQLVTSKKYLALDVVSALERESLLPALTEVLKRDETGAVALAIQSLLSSRTRKKIIAVFQEGIAAKAPPSAHMVMWDTLGRLGVEVDERLILRALGDESFEIRDAALYYARMLARSTSEPRWLVPIKAALTREPFQLRVRAIHAIWDLPSNLKDEGLTLLELCRKDSEPKVRELCLKPEGSS